jgi:hypothetical protein
MAGASSTLAGFAMVRKGWVGNPSRARVLRLVRALCPLLVALAVYCAAFVVLNPIATGDQPHYELASMSLAYDQSRNATRAYSDQAWTSTVYPGGRLSTYDEAYAYTNKHELMPLENVGLPLVLAAGVPWVEFAESQNSNDARWPWNLEMIILAAIAAQLLYCLLRRFRPHEPVLTAAVWMCTVFCAPMVVYASQIYPEIPMMLLALIVADCLTRKPTVFTGVVGGCAAAAMPWFHIRFVPVAVLLELALIVRAGAHHRARGRPTRSVVRAVAPVLAPFLASFALMAVAFQAWYGSPWITAPYRIAAVRQPQTLVASYRAITQLFLGSHMAALPFAPVGLLALVAVPLFCRRYGRWALFALSVATVYVLTVTIEGSWIGYSFQGRYMVWLIPFGAVPLLFLVTEYRIARLAFEALAVVTAWIAISVVAQPPDTVSQSGPDVTLWTRLVQLWPRIPEKGYTDVVAVAAWTACILIVAAAIYVAGTWGRRPARSRRLEAEPQT